MNYNCCFISIRKYKGSYPLYCITEVCHLTCGNDENIHKNLKQKWILNTEIYEQFLLKIVIICKFALECIIFTLLLINSSCVKTLLLDYLTSDEKFRY